MGDVTIKIRETCQESSAKVSNLGLITILETSNDNPLACVYRFRLDIESVGILSQEFLRLVKALASDKLCFG